MRSLAPSAKSAGRQGRQMWTHRSRSITNTIGDSRKTWIKLALDMRCVVERNPKTIAAKTEVMLNHFDAKIYRNHKLKGLAKAMVVTKDIEFAIIYYDALQDIAKENKHPYGILIAFSGTKTIKGKEYTKRT